MSTIVLGVREVLSLVRRELLEIMKDGGTLPKMKLGFQCCTVLAFNFNIIHVKPALNFRIIFFSHILRKLQEKKQSSKDSDESSLVDVLPCRMSRTLIMCSAEDPPAALLLMLWPTGSKMFCQASPAFIGALLCWAATKCTNKCGPVYESAEVTRVRRWLLAKRFCLLLLSPLCSPSTTSPLPLEWETQWLLTHLLIRFYRGKYRQRGCSCPGFEGEQAGCMLPKQQVSNQAQLPRFLISIKLPQCN